MQKLFGRTSINDRAPHPPQRRRDEGAVSAGDPRMVSGVVDKTPSFVDSIREMRRLNQARLPHAVMQPLKCARVFGWRNVIRRHSFVVRPQSDHKVVVLVDARLDPRIEGLHRCTAGSKMSRDLHVELGAVAPSPRRDPSENAARLELQREPV